MKLTNPTRASFSPGEFNIQRNSLKDQAANFIRHLIVSGQIAPGSVITERDIAEKLNISRMPARDALMDLERQGLVVTKVGRRQVIQLDEKETRQLYQLRIALERLAVELAIQHHSEANQEALEAKLADMRQAIAVEDTARYSASDLEMHELIWQQAENPYLLDILYSMIGPIFLFIASQAHISEDWKVSLRLHEQLVATIVTKDTQAAQRSIETHLQHSLELALSAFKIADFITEVKL
jgi:DNA-binding GntR family transcriptional regulator